MEKYPVLEKTIVGKNIEDYRTQHHMKRKDLASKLYVTEQAIYKWERGVGLPSVDALWALAKLFGCSVDDILRDKDDKKKFS